MRHITDEDFRDSTSFMTYILDSFKWSSLNASRHDKLHSTITKFSEFLREHERSVESYRLDEATKSNFVAALDNLKKFHNDLHDRSSQ